MATVFPASLDTFSTKVNGVDDVLAADTNNLQDAVSALQAKVGTNGSAVASSLDKRMSVVEGVAAGGGQSWQDVRASRTWDTVYQNTTGRSIEVILSVKTSSPGRQFQVSQNNVTWITTHTWSQDGVLSSHSVSIPPGWYYRQAGGLVTLLDVWVELR